MAVRVNHNLASLNVSRHLGIHTRNLGTRVERLASGLRINRGADDAAGLAVSESMRADIKALQQAVRNAEQGINMIQVAEGTLNEVSSMLVRMRELAVQASSSTFSDDNRVALQTEFANMIAEIDRISVTTQYNKQVLLTGLVGAIISSASTAIGTLSPTTGVKSVSVSGAQPGTYTFVDQSSTDNQITLGNGVVTQTVDIGTSLDNDFGGVEGAIRNLVATGTTVVANFDRLGVQVTLAGSNVTDVPGRYIDGDLDGSTIIIEQSTGGVIQIGGGNTAADKINIDIKDMRASGSELNLAGTSIGTVGNAQNTISRIDAAIQTVARQRGDMGAVQSRFNFIITATNNSIENIQAAESSIRDADMADEVAEFTRTQILSQFAMSMMAQANSLPQSALSLLQ